MGEKYQIYAEINLNNVESVVKLYKDEYHFHNFKLQMSLRLEGHLQQYWHIKNDDNYANST